METLRYVRWWGNNRKSPITCSKLRVTTCHFESARKSSSSSYDRILATNFQLTSTRLRFAYNLFLSLSGEQHNDPEPELRKLHHGLDQLIRPSKSRLDRYKVSYLSPLASFDPPPSHIIHVESVRKSKHISTHPQATILVYSSVLTSSTLKLDPPQAVLSDHSAHLGSDLFEHRFNFKFEQNYGLPNEQHR